jgi:hypothetical protein
MKIEEDYNQAAQITIFALRGKIDFHEMLYSINHAFADMDSKLHGVFSLI